MAGLRRCRALLPDHDVGGESGASGQAPMSAAQRASMVAVVILGAGGVGFLVHRLAANDRASSFEDSINAAASAASDTTHRAASSSSATVVSPDGADRSAAQVLAGSDGGEGAGVPKPPAGGPPERVPTLSLPDV